MTTTKLQSPKPEHRSPKSPRSSATRSLFRSSDPSKCNAAMGIGKLSDPARKLRFCQRDRATCPYHS